jgi:hypothetical protein
MVAVATLLSRRSAGFFLLTDLHADHDLIDSAGAAATFASTANGKNDHNRRDLRRRNERQIHLVGDAFPAHSF